MNSTIWKEDTINLITMHLVLINIMKEQEKKIQHFIDFYYVVISVLPKRSDSLVQGHASLQYT